MTSSSISSSSPPSSAGQSPIQVKPGRFRIDERYIAPIFITCVLIGANFAFGVLESPLHTGLAIVTSIVMELILGRLFTGKWPHLASAYVSGISVGILVRSPYLWPFMLCSAISITSKYVIRINGRHLWNPSNLGIVCLILIAPKYAATLSIQWDNKLWPMFIIWTLGSLIIYRLKRFHICLTYVLCFIGFAYLRSLILHGPFLAEVAPITGPMYQLFTFFMITDPKTTVKSKYGQMLVAFLIAFTENLFRLYGSLASPVPGTLADAVVTHAPYFALTIMGPTSNLIDALSSRRKAHHSSLPAPRTGVQ